MTFDIRKLAISATAIMPVRDAAGVEQFDENGQPIGIEFYGPGTLQFVRAKHDLVEKRRKQIGKNAERDAGDDIKDAAEFLTKVTKRLVNFDFPGGARALYEDMTLGHIAEEADQFVGKRGNFKPSSPTDSPNTSDTSHG